MKIDFQKALNKIWATDDITEEESTFYQMNMVNEVLVVVKQIVTEQVNEWHCLLRIEDHTKPQLGKKHLELQKNFPLTLPRDILSFPGANAGIFEFLWVTTKKPT